jgi:hypothetical protein
MNRLITILGLVLVVLCGCAGKGLKIDYVDPSGKNVTISTDYQVENGFTMERDGEGYKIDLGSATTKDAEMGIIAELLRMMTVFMAAGIPVAPQDANGN